MFDAAGDVIVRGLVHLHFGDWREVVDTWPRDGVPIFDPPYGIAYDSNWRLGYDRAKPLDHEARVLAVSVRGDEDTRERDEMLGRGWPAAAVFGPARLDRTPPWGDPRAVLIWDKGEGSGMGDLSFPWRPNFETIAIYGAGWAGRRTTSVLHGRVMTYSREATSNGRQHPHEKPLAVVAEIVGKAPTGRAIIDSHAGGGTTLVAAALLGREVYGAEIDPRYRDVILGRLAHHGIRVETTGAR